MKTASAKAKGRKLQQEVRNALRKLGSLFGLEPDDIESRGMGQNGVDVMFSPSARKYFDFAIECKNVEKLNVPATFFEHYKRYEKDSRLKLLIHSKNRSTPLITMQFTDFVSVLDRLAQLGVLERVFGKNAAQKE